MSIIVACFMDAHFLWSDVQRSMTSTLEPPLVRTLHKPVEAWSKRSKIRATIIGREDDNHRHRNCLGENVAPWRVLGNISPIRVLVLAFFALNPGTSCSQMTGYIPQCIRPTTSTSKVACIKPTNYCANHRDNIPVNEHVCRTLRIFEPLFSQPPQICPIAHEFSFLIFLNWQRFMTILTPHSFISCPR